jgi:hypothetical protein
VVAEKVQAMIWAQAWNCNDQWFNTVRNATYYYAKANAPSVGGASVTIDGNGTWFADSVAWSGATYFGGSEEYWTMTYDCDTTNKGCNSWTSNSGTRRGGVGQSTPAGNRGYGTNAVCSATKKLVCLVHP